MQRQTYKEKQGFRRRPAARLSNYLADGSEHLKKHRVTQMRSTYRQVINALKNIPGEKPAYLAVKRDYFQFLFRFPR